jgi:hypothetical protein
MLRRLLNIASIACLVLCVLLMGLWVRSYYVWDTLTFRWWLEHDFLIYGRTGEVAWSCPPPTLSTRLWESSPLSPHDSGGSIWTFSDLDFEPKFLLSIGFAAVRTGTVSVVMLPYWFLVLTSGSLGMITRARSAVRFNLRRLFIVTTFLAIVLGMIAWLDRAWIGK